MKDLSGTVEIPDIHMGTLAFLPYMCAVSWINGSYIEWGSLEKGAPVVTLQDINGSTVHTHVLSFQGVVTIHAIYVYNALEPENIDERFRDW